MSVYRMSVCPNHGSNSRISQASATLYRDQTPFAEFSWQVHVLCKTLWPTSFEEVHIEYMKGGSWNRVVGLSILNGFPAEDTPILQDDSPPESPTSSIDSDTSQEDTSPPRSPSASSSDSDDSIFVQATEQEGKRYVVRLPRHRNESLSEYVATIQYLNRYTTLPVPKLFYYDLTSDNPLGSPYSIQYRAPGMPLNRIYSKLNYRQQVDVVKEVARVMLDMQKVESSVAGAIGYSKTNTLHAGKLNTCDVIVWEFSGEDDVLRNEVSHLEEDFKIFHYDWCLKLKGIDTYDGTVSNLAGLDPFGIISFQFARLTIAELFRYPTSSYMAQILSRLSTVAREMDDFGYLGHEHKMTLCHNDFEARNLMAIVKNDEYGTVKISSILDWDDAIFAPRFMSCLPPRWLWSDMDDDTIDEPSSYDDPVDPDLCRLKDIFDDCVGWRFTMYSYKPQWRIARRLFRFALSGFSSNEDYAAADSLLSEWDEIRNRKLAKREKRKQEEEEGGEEEGEEEREEGGEEEREEGGEEEREEEKGGEGEEEGKRQLEEIDLE